MSTPHGDVIDRLERLAAQAPVAGVDPDSVWVRGRRRQRRTWAAVAGCAVAVAGLGALALPPTLRLADQHVAVSPDSSALVLPDHVRQPGGWEPDFSRAPGPLVAVGLGGRSGWRSDEGAWWGVSGVTGESRFLDLPEAVGDSAALSTDGRKLAYWISEGEAGADGSDGRPTATGVAITDLVTGEEERWSAAAPFGLASFELAWAGDVLWIQGGAFDDAAQDSWHNTFWSWRAGSEPVAVSSLSGQFTLYEAQPITDGLVLQEGSATSRLRVITSDAPPATITLVHDGGVTSPTMSPGGRRVAGIWQEDPSTFDGAPHELLVGTVVGGRAEMAEVPGVDAHAVLGWRSPREVVVVTLDEDDGGVPTGNRAWAVDVTTGERHHLLNFTGNVPQFAADAWPGELVEAPEAPFAPDPRQVAFLIGFALVVGTSIWRSIKGRRGHP